MTPVALFLKTNHLKQVDLARYLSITEGSVSKMVKGTIQPSKENLRKILSNDKGWDTTPLTNTIEQNEAEAEEIRKEIARLRQRIEQLKEDGLCYRGLIMKLNLQRSSREEES